MNAELVRILVMLGLGIADRLIFESKNGKKISVDLSSIPKEEMMTLIAELRQSTYPDGYDIPFKFESSATRPE
jgi:hypothetical protein